MPKKILIIGANGNTGQAISNRLGVLGNYETFNLARSFVNDFRNENDKKKFFLLDLNNIKDCENFAKKIETKFDSIIYTAACWRGKNKSIDDLTDNLIPFSNFLNTFAKYCNHIVYFSSSLVYENNSYPESILSNIPESTYGISKLLSEHLLIDFCKKNNIYYSIFRPFHIVSPYERYNPGSSHVVTDWVQKTMNGESIDFLPFKQHKLPFTWVYDIVDAVISSLENVDAYNQIFNIGAENSHSLGELYELIGNLLEGRPINLTMSNENNPQFTKSYNILGKYAKTTLKKMLEVTILEKKKNGF